MDIKVDGKMFNAIQVEFEIKQIIKGITNLKVGSAFFVAKKSPYNNIE